jgi:hypothetical protein
MAHCTAATHALKLIPQRLSRQRGSTTGRQDVDVMLRRFDRMPPTAKEDVERLGAGNGVAEAAVQPVGEAK